MDVSEFGLLSVRGEDRLRFLHNQLTNRYILHGIVLCTPYYLLT